MLLRRAASEATPEGRALLAQEAADLAGVLQDPVSKARVLASAAAVLAPAPEAERLAEQARQAALLVSGVSERALLLAGVAGQLGRECRSKAEECLREAIALAGTLDGGGPRARVMMELGIACAPGLSDEALRIAGSLGKGRLASRIEVLVAIAETADDAGRAEATRELLAASPGAGAASDQLRVLRRLTLDALPPAGAEAAVSHSDGEAVAAETAGTEGDAPPAAPWPLPAPKERVRCGAPIPEGGSPPPTVPEEPAEESVSEQAPDAGDLASAQLEVWNAIGDLMLERAKGRPDRTQRATAYIEAAEWLSPRDPARAAMALSRAAAELDGAPDSVGRLDVVLAQASALGPDVAPCIARALKDPQRRARSLVACGLVDEALADLSAIKDPWERAGMAVELALAGATPTGAAAVRSCLEVLPPSARRDDLLARAIEGLALSPLDEAGQTAVFLTGIVSGEEALARARLAAARRSVADGDLAAANERLAQARELIVAAGRPQICLARLAVVEHLLGGDGVTTARGLLDHSLRARALLEIADLLLAPLSAGPQDGPV